jgi:hypothetical protein
VEDNSFGFEENIETDDMELLVRSQVFTKQSSDAGKKKKMTKKK